MKYKFNDDTIVTGYIKELLYNFNLPMIPVYNENVVDGMVYIKNRSIIKLENGIEKKISDYDYNKNIVNLTKKLIINSTTYDNYTHEYLGNYLRFMRDYNKLDLMPLYNCFMYNSIDNIEYNDIKLNDTYTTYVIPVKLNKEYTIAIDCDTAYSISCILYDKYLIEGTMLDNLYSESFKTISGSYFKKPFIYSTKFSNDLYWKKENNLKMVVRIPRSCKSTITILEGNYIKDSIILDGVIVKPNLIGDAKKEDVTKLSLLKLNDGTSYPFASRLIEYLLGNTINQLDKISKNIERVQSYIFGYKGIQGYYGVWDDNLKNEISKITNSIDYTKGVTKKYSNTILKNNTEEIKFERNFIDNKYDILNYVDRDVEKLLKLNYKINFEGGELNG